MQHAIYLYLIVFIKVLVFFSDIIYFCILGFDPKYWSKIAETPEKFGVGATPSISANGKTNGIVWAIERTQWLNASISTEPAILHAYDARNVAVELYSSTTNPTRDKAGNATKFNVPTVVNGKVYIGTQSELDVYGLLP